MAEIVDYVEPEGEFETVEKMQTEAEQAKVADVTKPEEIDDIPEKFRGKGVKDLAKVIQDQEAMIGRQANEVGEIRKLADELIQSQLQKKSEVEQPKEVDFFENPQEAIRQAVENNPKVVAAERMAQQMGMSQAKQVFEAKHPDAREIIQDGEFVNWVKSSPIRTQLFKMADAYNVDAADELLSTYKQLKTVRQAQDNTEDKKVRDSALKAAAVDTGGSGESGKKIYRRADLIRLRMTDPQRYDALSDEITRAYQENRVK